MSGLVAVFAVGVIIRDGVAGGWRLLTIGDSPELHLSGFGHGAGELASRGPALADRP